MTDENVLESLVGDDTRREFVKKGATAAAVAGLGATGVAGAQQGDGGDGGDALTEGWKGLMWIEDFNPNARFTFVSGVVNWTPSFGDIQDSWFSDYNTRMIKYLNSGRTVPLFVAQDANVGQYDEDLGFVTDVDDDPNQPQVFQMNKEWTPFGDNPNMVTVNVSPVGEDEEDRVLQDEDWWIDSGGNGGGGNNTGGGGGNNTGGGNNA